MSESPKTRALVIMLLLVVTTFVAMWCLDISISAILVGAIMTNGFLIMDPTQMYHISLYTIAFCVFCLGLDVIYLASALQDKIDKGR